MSRCLLRVFKCAPFEVLILRSGNDPNFHFCTVLGPLQSVMQDLHSDDNDDDSEDDDDNDMDSDMERPAHTHLTHHSRRSVNDLQLGARPLTRVCFK